MRSRLDAARLSASRLGGRGLPQQSWRPHWPRIVWGIGGVLSLPGMPGEGLLAGILKRGGALPACGPLCHSRALHRWHRRRCNISDYTRQNGVASGDSSRHPLGLSAHGSQYWAFDLSTPKRRHMAKRTQKGAGCRAGWGRQTNTPHSRQLFTSRLRAPSSLMGLVQPPRPLQAPCRQCFGLRGCSPGCDILAINRRTNLHAEHHSVGRNHRPAP